MHFNMLPQHEDVDVLRKTMCYINVFYKICIKRVIYEVGHSVVYI